MKLRTAWWGLLVIQITGLHAKHVFIPRPDDVDGDLKESGKLIDKHLDKRMSQWYHGFQKLSCGRQAIEPINPEFKIIGGKPAIPGSWPWMVSIYTTIPFPTHCCGGALISDQWVVTAAHCKNWIFAGLATISNFTVRVGKNFLYETEESEQSIDVEEFISHPLYDVGTNDYDIALIKLKKKVRWNERVSPICLPDIYPQPLSPYEQYIATGWGVTTTSKDIQYSPVLRQVVLPLIDKDRCEKFPAIRGSITDREFCAGYTMGGRDTCAGDSGSPLQYQDDGIWFVKGIVSHGVHDARDCGYPYRPGIYTDVPQLVRWILWEMFLYN